MIYDHEHKESKWKTYSGPPPKMPPFVNNYAPLATEYLTKRELDPYLAAKNGWYPTLTDVPRIVIPCANPEGSVYYQARAIGSNSALRYDSPTAPRGSSVVVCWPYATLHSFLVVFVEGPMDALAAAGCGFLGIAFMGNNPTIGAIDYAASLVKPGHIPVLIVPDRDDIKFGATLLALFGMRGVPGKVILPIEKDLAEMTQFARRKLLLPKGKK